MFRLGYFLLAAVLALQATGPVEGTFPLIQHADLYSRQPQFGSATEVRNWQFKVGNLVLVAATGTVTPLMSQNRLVGYYFHGGGSLLYTATSPKEWAVLRSNHGHNLTKTNSKAILAESDGGLILTEALTGFTVWFAGTEPVPPQGPLGAVPVKDFEREWAFFNRDGLGDRGQDFAVALADAPQQPTVRVEASGVDAPFVYSYDPGYSMLEQLVMVGDPYQPTFYNGLRRVVISEQPIGWSWEAPMTAAVNLTHVDIDLHAGKSQADLWVKETLVASVDNLRVVPLNLYSTLDPAFKRGVYQVRRVLDGQGRELPFVHRHDRILVALAQPQPAGHPFDLTFEYGGQILLHPNGDNYWELGVAPWFPQPDLSGQSYTVHATFRTPKDDVPIACGTTVRREVKGGENLLEVRIDKPVQFFSAFAGAYTLKEETKDGLTVRIATYADLGGRQEQLLNLARQTIRYYESILETFPFPEFNIIQVNSWGFGQAPPGMMIITNEAFNSHTDFISQFFIKGINQRFAHEIAHQYFGHLVKMPSYEEQWITESFANYASLLAIRSMKNQGNSAYEGLLSRWRNDSAPYAGESPIPFANRLRWLNDPRGSYLARTFLLYEKGGLLLATLHKEMGDKTFAVFMKSLLANFRWKFLTTQSVEQMASMAAHKDLHPLFRDCYWGTAMPPK
ncbi:hypothetical protein GETHPA_28180 [Geothrix rubra]|uniref:Peptidase M1 membrane alanine aminopeptidase domain-containing protein n=1 Tax=Geothrix rubra TaxID=2927977 RepID=A0ABQ5QAY4_9BACT|nr:M1 family aminopeptidase [Geothrix rubra]GLH71285.1 hypothetical protein GETHPA_28180 [Geothrix rubra]